MRMDKTVQILTPSQVQNAIGEVVNTWSVSREIRVIAQPIKADVLLKQYGIVGTAAMLIFTYDTITEPHYRLRIDNVDYDVKQYLPYRKHREVIVEKVIG